MSKREPGLDLLRCLAFLFVVLFHSFLYNGFYSEPQSGVYMLLSNGIRWLSVSCIGIFLMLTGYLKSPITDCKICYTGLLPVILGYLLASAVSIPVRHFLLGDEQSFITWIKRLFNFSAVYYGWYVEMYIVLMLLVPFINLLLEKLDTPRKLLSFAGVLLIITALPGATPLSIAPDYWRGLYPLTYYVLGAVVKRLQPKINPWVGILCALLIAFSIGSVTLLSTDGNIYDAFTQEFADLWIVGIVVCLFLALYRINLRPSLQKAFAFTAGGCYGGYLFSHLLDAFCYKLFSRWHAPSQYLKLFISVTVPIYVLSVLAGKLLQVFLRKLSRRAAV